jgi:hypothetical protein
MVLSKTKLYLILVILAAIIGFLIFNGMKSRAERDALLEEKQFEKEEIMRIRDSAQTARERDIDNFEWTFDSLSEINKKIIYVPYEKFKYIDRTLNDAINILDSTNYEQ